MRLLDVLGDRHALAGREPVRLDHDSWTCQLADRLDPLLQRRNLSPGGGWDSSLFHRLLGKRLRALQFGGRRARAEGHMTALGERIDESGDERRLRPHHGQVHSFALHGLHESVDVVHRDVQHSCVSGDPGVAGRTQQLRLLWGARQSPHKRVLPATGSDNEHLHRRSITSHGSCESWIVVVGKERKRGQC